MMPPFPPYRGDEPYIFVCYAHADAALVYPEMTWLNNQGVNIWYDEGIEPTREWRAEIASALARARLLVFYLSSHSTASPDCNREVSMALDRRIPVLTVHLERVDLPPALELGLQNVQGIYRSDLDAAEYQRRLVAAVTGRLTEKVPTPPRSTPGLVLGSVVALVTVLLGGGLWWTTREHPETPRGDHIRFQTLAITPFEDLSANGNLAPLATAITRQLTTRLDELPAVRIARPDVGDKAEAPLVVTGYLQRDGDRIEASVEIVRKDDGQVLWSATLTRGTEDTALLARYFVGELFRFVASVSSHPRPGPSTIEAYRAWLQWHFHRANIRNFDEVRWIERALQLEPTYAWGHLDAYDTYHTVAWDGRDPQWVRRAGEALQAARQAGIPPDDPAYRGYLGRYLVYLRGDLEAGEPHLRETRNFLYNVLLLDSGLHAPGRELIERAITGNPVAGTWNVLGWARGLDGDLAGAKSAFHEGLKRAPDNPYLLLQYNRALIALGELDEARETIERLAALSPLQPGGELGLRVNRIRLLQRLGKRAEALTEIERLAEEDWHLAAGRLYLELEDPRAATELRKGAQAPLPMDRLPSSTFWHDPAKLDHALIREVMDTLGYTLAWRREICSRAIPYARDAGVALSCELPDPRE